MSPQKTVGVSTPGQKQARQRVPSGWPAVTGLLLLCALPVLGGVLRLSEVSADPEGALLSASPVPIVAHIIAMSVYCVLGAFQFSPSLRSRGWHRAAGRVLIPAGFIGALSAVWLAVVFGGPAEEVPLAMVRAVFGLAMTTFLVLATIAIRHRDFTAHGAWMTRAYALAIAGSTQALILILWSLPFGDVTSTGETWLVAAGFVINSVAAELLIRRRAGRRVRRAPGRGALVS